MRQGRRARASSGPRPWSPGRSDLAPKCRVLIECNVAPQPSLSASSCNTSSASWSGSVGCRSVRRNGMGESYQAARRVAKRRFEIIRRELVFLPTGAAACDHASPSSSNASCVEERQIAPSATGGQTKLAAAPAISLRDTKPLPSHASSFDPDHFASNGIQISRSRMDQRRRLRDQRDQAHARRGENRSVASPPIPAAPPACRDQALPARTAASTRDNVAVSTPFTTRMLASPSTISIALTAGRRSAPRIGLRSLPQTTFTGAKVTAAEISAQDFGLLLGSCRPPDT